MLIKIKMLVATCNSLSGPAILNDFKRITEKEKLE